MDGYREMTLCTSLELVIFLHGIWMPGTEMKLLKSRVKRAGFQVKTFSYQSILKSPVENFSALEMFIREQNDSTLHFVAHSLGGLLVMEMIRRGAIPTNSKIILLASPVNGSQVARSLKGTILGKILLGQSESLLTRGKLDLDLSNYQVATIAGNSSFGLGRVLVRFEGEYDGTVSVQETRIEGAKDQLVLPLTHTGIVFSRQVAQNCIHFLKNASFQSRSTRF